MNLLSKLTTPEELSGLLNMAIIGLNRLLKQNCFSESQGTTRMLNKWKYANDTIQQFIDECCVAKGCTTTAELFSHYKSWTNESGLTPIGRNDFYEKIVSKMNLVKVKVGNHHAFDGISLVNGINTFDSVSNF